MQTEYVGGIAIAVTWGSSQGLNMFFFSYLTLLINTKNLLALAHALDVPNRGFRRMAFTAPEHVAHTDTTSLFLAATPFRTAIQLGVKGYAPP